MKRPSARTAPPPPKLSEDVAPGGVATGAATCTDALGAILARAVAQRAQGGQLQRFLGIGKKKKAPARPTQALPAPARPTQALPAPARPSQALPAVVPQTQSLFEARQFDMGSADADLFQARQFDLGPPAAAFTPRGVDTAPRAPASVAATGDGKFAPELVPDETGLIPVKGNPYLEDLVSRFASNRGVMTPRSYGDLRNLQVIASLTGAPPPRPIDPRYLAASSTAYDWGFAY